MFDEDLPRKSASVVDALAREDLDPLSIEQLHERIAALEAEITRTQADIERKTKHRSAADALFKS